MLKSTERERLPVGREHLLHVLYEAAELEHDLMCTYLYAAFSLRTGDDEGLSPRELEAVRRWRANIFGIALEEMGHLAAVSNITAALGGAPHFGRGNFPLDPGELPAGVVVKLAPFSEATLQHFIHLERPEDSSEADGEGFVAEFAYSRGSRRPSLTPMAVDYDTVGAFYAKLGADLEAFVTHHGDRAAFASDPARQLSRSEVEPLDVQPVLCLKTALAAFQAIVVQGEGADASNERSHYRRFLTIRDELRQLKLENPSFTPAFPSAENPLLRPPLRSTGRVWIEDERAAATVDLANACYALMLRLLAYSYNLARPSEERTLAVDLSLLLMRAATPLAECAARLPAGPSHPGCNAGMSFTALRDASPLSPGSAARMFFMERAGELAQAAEALAADGDARTRLAAQLLASVAKRALGFERAAAQQPLREPNAMPGAPSLLPEQKIVDGVEIVEGKRLTLLYEGKRCIHARFCVTGAPKVFLANVQGPWIHPDELDVEGLVSIAHACPSGAIRYRRKDGAPEEQAPPVNLLAVREAGPYALRGELRMQGESIPYRATLCRCGASKRKPYCDGSHHDVAFTASGEPPTMGSTDMLPVRNGPLEVEPELHGPLRVRGNLEITSGTGRVVSRLTSAKLCRCGASNTKPFCDRSHERVGFRSE